MSSIESLTAAQKAQLSVYCDKWIEIGLSTSRGNEEEGAFWLGKAYEAAELKPPKQIVWLQSPLGCLLAKVVLNDSVWDSVWDSVNESVGDSVWDSVNESVNESVKRSVRDSVWDSVKRSVRDSVRQSAYQSVDDSVNDSVWDSVNESVSDSVWQSAYQSVDDSVNDSVWDSVWDFIYGQHDAHWLGFYDYMDEVLHINVQALRPLQNLARHAHWILPYQDVAFISHKPIALHLNADGRLHHPDQLAIEYGDGWGVFALNGIRATEQIITTPADQIPLDWWANESNVELRREIEKKIGPQRIFQQANMNVLHSAVLSINGIDLPYELREYDIATPNGPKRRALHMQNPSIDAEHTEWVPPEIETVEQAISWRNDIDVLPAILT